MKKQQEKKTESIKYFVCLCVGKNQEVKAVSRVYHILSVMRAATKSGGQIGEGVD